MLSPICQLIDSACVFINAAPLSSSEQTGQLVRRIGFPPLAGPDFSGELAAAQTPVCARTLSSREHIPPPNTDLHTHSQRNGEVTGATNEEKRLHLPLVSPDNLLLSACVYLSRICVDFLHEA